MDIAIGLLIGLAIGVFYGKYFRSMSERKGPAKVRHLLTNTFESYDYHLLNNVMLPTDDGSTHVDHILVSLYGVFVIQTRHCSGHIYANEKSRKWTQTTFRHKKTKFINPLFENYQHIKAIEALSSEIIPGTLHNVVVFTGDAEFKVSKPRHVLYLRDLVEHIATFSTQVLSFEQMYCVIGILESNRYMISKQTDVEHARHLDMKFGEPQA